MMSKKLGKMMYKKMTVSRNSKSRDMRLDRSGNPTSVSISTGPVQAMSISASYTFICHLRSESSLPNVLDVATRRSLIDP
jgi:hypothetical protein